jgi:hypothetical protein
MDPEVDAEPGPAAEPVEEPVPEAVPDPERPLDGELAAEPVDDAAEPEVVGVWMMTVPWEPVPSSVMVLVVEPS